VSQALRFRGTPNASGLPHTRGASCGDRFPLFAAIDGRLRWLNRTGGHRFRLLLTPPDAEGGKALHRRMVRVDEDLPIFVNVWVARLFTHS